MGKAGEDLNHLLFVCSFSKDIWKTDLHRNGIKREAGSWNQESKGNDFQAKMRRLISAASVYCVWGERNKRSFLNEAQDWEGVLLKIEDIVKTATWKWKAKRNWVGTHPNLGEVMSLSFI